MFHFPQNQFSNPTTADAMVANLKCLLLISQLLMFPLCLTATVSAAQTKIIGAQPASSKVIQKRSNIDRSGKARKGDASYYGHAFYRKKMANSKPMNPNSNVAASKTL